MLTRHGRLFLVGTLVGGALLVACRPNAGTPAPAPEAVRVDAPEVAAERAAEAWLALIDRALYDASWDSAATTVQRAVPRAQWRETLLQARVPFEPFGARRLLSRQYTTAPPSAPQGEQVVLQYATQVDGGRTIVETVAAAPEAGGWRVSGYFIRPR